jgi:hypothetical protein
MRDPHRPEHDNPHKPELNPDRERLLEWIGRQPGRVAGLPNGGAKEQLGH